MNNVEHYLSIQNELGETPIWVPEEKSLYWVDFIRNTIFRIDVETGKHESFAPDMPVRGLCRRGSKGWLVITEAGLAFWDPTSNQCELVVDPYKNEPDLQLNDGVIDRQGRLLVGCIHSEGTSRPITP